MTERTSDAFDAILLGNGVEGSDPEGKDPAATLPDKRVRGHGKTMLLLSISCVTAGLLIVSGAILVTALAGPRTPPSSASADQVPAAVVPSPTPHTTPDQEPGWRDEGPAGVSALPDTAWVEELAERTGIPPRALAAYAGASMQIANESPGCGLGWNTLAGIGHVESVHGTIYGSQIGSDGVANPAIIGIPLTGETTMQIRDSDDGILDGDTVWDRAIGPMQFIPTTWDEWGSDGNSDGARDPHNIDDSALAAARYLCFAGGDLTQPANWIAAVHAYNPSIEYNNSVATAAEDYASFSGP